MSFPNKKNKVFAVSKTNKAKATLASSFFKNQYMAYEMAYKTAGDLLVKSAIDDDSLFMDISIYPIAFLYRQFVELYIKDILLKFDDKYKTDSNLNKSHDLYALWSRLKDIVVLDDLAFPKELDNMPFEDVISSTESYIIELSKMDNMSMAFRYPDNKTHNQNFFEIETPVNLENLKDRVNEIANILCIIEESLINQKTFEEEII